MTERGAGMSPGGRKTLERFVTFGEYARTPAEARAAIRSLLVEEERLRDAMNDEVIKVALRDEIVRDLKSRIEAALALHVEKDGNCGVCMAEPRGWNAPEPLAYPCPTVKALKGERE